MKLHLGCGKRHFKEEGWVHIDGADFPHIEYKNVAKFPFEDNSVDLIYSSHLIAYFDREEFKEVLKEWKRVLKPGGKLRIATPDAHKLTWLYKDKMDLSLVLGPMYGRMEMGDKKIYHKTMYDFSDLSFILEDSGFKNIEMYDWRKTEHAHYDDHSQAYYPHFAKETGTLLSLNVECIKP